MRGHKRIWRPDLGDLSETDSRSRWSRWNRWKGVNHTHNWKIGSFVKRLAMQIKVFTELQMWLMKKDRRFSTSWQNYKLKINGKMLLFQVEEKDNISIKLWLQLWYRPSPHSLCFWNFLNLEESVASLLRGFTLCVSSVRLQILCHALPWGGNCSPLESGLDQRLLGQQSGTEWCGVSSRLRLEEDRLLCFLLLRRLVLRIVLLWTQAPGEATTPCGQSSEFKFWARKCGQNQDPLEWTGREKSKIDRL